MAGQTLQDIQDIMVHGIQNVPGLGQSILRDELDELF
jgi:hypothetical protein